MSKRILIIAGPNGAGKTTFAREFLPNEAACPTFVNADEIAARLSPGDPEAVAVRAGRLMLAEIDSLVRRDESFAFETTLSGRGYLRHIAGWRRNGYRVELVFLSLPTPEVAIDRVAVRVALGGHRIPPDVIRRRFYAGRENFDRLYKSSVDAWAEYDSFRKPPVLIAEGPHLMAKKQDDRAFRLEDIEAALARASETAKRLADEAGLPFVACEDGRSAEEHARTGQSPPKAVREAG